MSTATPSEPTPETGPPGRTESYDFGGVHVEVDRAGRTVDVWFHPLERPDSEGWKQAQRILGQFEHSKLVVDETFGDGEDAVNHTQWSF